MQAARGYWWWLGAAVVSDLGSNVMAFAVTWTASGFGGTAAGLIASTIVAFRVVLLMLGGSIGDRFGPRAVMIGCDTLMLIIAAGYAVWFFVSSPTVAMMLSLGCVLGIVSAFYIPASGVFPRLFVDEGSLPAVMATTSSGLQVSRLSGPAVGGLLIASVGLAWMTVINAATFLVVLIALVLVIPPRPARQPGAPHVTLRQGWSAIRAAGQHRVIFGLLAGLTVLSGAVQPVVSVGIPLLSRSHGWSAADAGFIEAAFMAAALPVGLTIAARGAMSRAAKALVGGPVLAGVGLLILAWAPYVVIACLGAAVLAVGTVLFASHALPAFLSASPPGLQVRLQAVLGVVQALPVLLMNLVYGVIAQHWSPPWAVLLASLLMLTTAVIMLTNPATRTIQLPKADPTTTGPAAPARPS